MRSAHAAGAVTARQVEEVPSAELDLGMSLRLAALMPRDKVNRTGFSGGCDTNPGAAQCAMPPNTTTQLFAERCGGKGVVLAALQSHVAGDRFPVPGDGYLGEEQAGHALAFSLRVGLDYTILPLTCSLAGAVLRIRSSLDDLLGRLPARPPPARLSGAARPAWCVQGRRTAGAPARERGAAPPGRPGPLPAGRSALARGPVPAGPATAGLRCSR